MNNELETARFYLRPITEADTQHLFELDSDPEVMRYINGGHPMPYEAVVMQLMPRVLECVRSQAPLGFWSATCKTTQAFAGWFHFYPAKEHPMLQELQQLQPQDVVLGYRLHQRFWGQGMATEGAQALVAKGFEEWQVQRVIAWALTVNRGSTRVMEKVGLRSLQGFWFTEAQLSKVKPEERRAVMYVLDRATYFAQQTLGDRVPALSDQ